MSPFVVLIIDVSFNIASNNHFSIKRNLVKTILYFIFFKPRRALGPMNGKHTKEKKMLRDVKKIKKKLCFEVTEDGQKKKKTL
jgi:hypothetical protein